MKPRIARLLAVILMAGGCRSDIEFERPIPPDLEPIRKAFHLFATEIWRPADFVLRTAEDARELERLVGYADEPIQMPTGDSVIVAAAAGEGRSGDPRIAFAGFRVDGDTTTVFVTVVRPIWCEEVTDDVRAEVIGGVVPDNRHVQVERIHGWRRC
jgi:hypothetical protein